MISMSNDYKCNGSSECDVVGELIWFKDGES